MGTLHLPSGWGRRGAAPSRARRLTLALALAALAALALPRLVLAHAYLDRADPAPGSQLGQPPQQLRLVFTEPLDPSFSRVQVFDARRQQVDLGDSRVAPDEPRALLVSLRDGLPNGVYTVAWRTLSTVDGHSTSGAYPLIVGPLAEGAPAVESSTTEAGFAPETAVARWWTSLAASGVFGALLAFAFVFTPLLRHAQRPAWEAAAAQTRRLAIVCGALLVAGTLYAGVAQAAVAANLPLWQTLGGPLGDVLTQGRFAGVWWSRLGLAVVALALVFWGGAGTWSAQAAPAVVASLLLSSSLSSHGAALTSGAYLGIAADWVHYLGVATWIGGLLSLTFVLPVAVRASERGGEALRPRAIGRFTRLALASVIAIVATGTFQTWLQVGSWDGLAQTPYGQSILVKVALAAVMLALAAVSALVLRPRLAALARREPAAARATVRAFRGAVRAELAVGILVLVAAAVLTGLAPAREELARRASGQTTAGPVNRRVDAQGLAAQVQVAPASVGENRFVVSLPGTDPRQVERVQLTLTYLEADFGSQPLILSPAQTSPFTWEAASPLLSQPGQWQVELLVRRTDQDDAQTAFRFAVAGPGGAGVEQAALAAAYPLLPSPGVSIASALGLAGIVAIAAGVLRRGRAAQQGRAALVGAGLVVLLGGGYVYAQEQQSGVTLDVANVRNPIPPDATALARGQAIYASRCATCHGDDGRGDGPAGLRLVPRPADLRVHMAAGHTDGQLFYWVSYGVQGTAMPAWKDHLSEQERWEVIDYIRTFAQSSPSTAPTASASPTTSPP